MGLDLVELVTAVEDRFGLTLSDDDAVRTATPRKLVDLIYSRLGQEEISGCLTSLAFYLVRKALMHYFECHREQVLPDAQLEELVPRTGRRAHWEQLKYALQVSDWESLARPKWLVRLIWGLAALLALASVKLWLEGFGPELTLPCAGVILGLALLATRPVCREIPEKLSTVRDLARYVVTFGPCTFDKKGQTWSCSDVAAAVRELTIAELRIRPEDYRENAHFVKDLGAS